MSSAKADVGIVAADLHLRAFGQHPAIAALAHDHCGFLPAVADGANLAHLISQGQQSRRSGEQLAPEIDAQPIAHHRHAHIIDNAGKLPNLGFGQKLSFIDKNTGNRANVQSVVNQIEHVIIWRKRLGLGLEADTRADLARAYAHVQLRSQKIGGHAALAIIMRGLQ